MIIRLRDALLLLLVLCPELRANVILSNSRYSTSFISEQARWVTYEFAMASNTSRLDLQIVSLETTFRDDLEVYLQFGAPIDQTNPPAATGNGTWVSKTATLVNEANSDCQTTATDGCAMLAISLSPCEVIAGTWYAAVYFSGTPYHTVKVKYDEASAILSATTAVPLSFHNFELRRWQHYVLPTGPLAMTMTLQITGPYVPRGMALYARRGGEAEEPRALDAEASPRL